MSVIRVVHNENYTTMANYHLRDPRLSLRAIGLMSKMLSLPDDWDYTVAGLAAICSEGREAVRNVLKELEAAGYLEREQSHGSGGRFAGYDYTLHEAPTRGEETAAENPAPGVEEPLPENPGDGEEPLPEKPLPGKPLPGFPPQLKDERTKELKNKEAARPPWMPEDIFAEILAYCGNDDELIQAWMGYASMRKQIKRPISTIDTVKRACRDLDKHSKGSRAYKLGMLHKAEDRSWRGLFPLDDGDPYLPGGGSAGRGGSGNAPTGERRDVLWI